MYKLSKNSITNEVTSILRLNPWLLIPFDEQNSEYQIYLKWLDGYELQRNSETGLPEWVKTSNGNTPLPADE
jgi:hypothetical protein